MGKNGQKFALHYNTSIHKSTALYLCIEDRQVFQSTWYTTHQNLVTRAKKNLQRIYADLWRRHTQLPERNYKQQPCVRRHTTTSVFMVSSSKLVTWFIYITQLSLAVSLFSHGRSSSLSSINC